MARGDISHASYLLLSLLVLQSLLCAAVLGTPFAVTPRREEHMMLQQHEQQTSLKSIESQDNGRKDDDPLKDFVSDVVHDTPPPPPASKSGNSNSNSGGSKPAEIVGDSPKKLRLSTDASSLRYVGHVDKPDNITIGLNKIINDDDEEDNDEITLTTRRPSWFDSVLLARRLLAKSSVAIASTVYQHQASSSSPSSISNQYAPEPASLQGVSISLPEYIADCSDFDDSDNNNGNPILLGLYVSTTFRNTAKGSNISLSIDWWDHVNDTKPIYPGFPLSEAGLPRISLIGYVELIDLSSPSSLRYISSKKGDDEQTKSAVASLAECFFATHPDAKVWAPGNSDSPHAGFWARMVVSQVYWIGGFGDLQQIGWVNMTEWRGVGRFESAPGIGDGRGWEDVRLPGE